MNGRQCLSMCIHFFSTMTNISTSVKTILSSLFTPAILAFGGLNFEADRQY